MKAKTASKLEKQSQIVKQYRLDSWMLYEGVIYNHVYGQLKNIRIIKGKEQVKLDFIGRQNMKIVKINNKDAFRKRAISSLNALIKKKAILDGQNVPNNLKYFIDMINSENGVEIDNFFMMYDENDFNKVHEITITMEDREYKLETPFFLVIECSLGEDPKYMKIKTEKVLTQIFYLTCQAELFNKHFGQSLHNKVIIARERRCLSVYGVIMTDGVLDTQYEDYTASLDTQRPDLVNCFKFSDLLRPRDKYITNTLHSKANATITNSSFIDYSYFVNPFGYENIYSELKKFTVINHEFLGEITTMKDSIRSNTGEVTKLRKGVDSLKIEVINFNNDIISLKRITHKNTQENKSLKEATAKNTQEIKSLKEATAKNTQEIKSLKEATAKNTKQIKSLNEATAENTKQIKSLKEATDKNTKELTSLKATVDQMNVNLTALTKLLTTYITNKPSDEQAKIQGPKSEDEVKTKVIDSVLAGIEQHEDEYKKCEKEYDIQSVENKQDEGKNKEDPKSPIEMTQKKGEYKNLFK